MTRFVRRAAFTLAPATALVALAITMIDARAQVTYEDTPAPDAGPEWTRSQTYRPARRFRATANLPPESKAIMESIKSGTYYGAPPGARGGTGLGGSHTGTGGGYDAPPPLPTRKKSGAPGTVAGLVYQRADKLPIGGVTLSLVSTEANFALERLIARTDSAGYYEFKNVEPGRWYLSVVADRLDPRYAPLRGGTIVMVAKKQQVAAEPFLLVPTSCAAGRTAWSDGYTLYDAPITVAPYDTTLLTVSGIANGVGDFKVCGAATDSVMVWMHLRDGRSLGRTTRLTTGGPAHVDFVADPLEKMEGNILRVTTVMNDGRPVGKARITVVGRRFEQGKRPALVFVREESTDRDGVLDLRVPWGVYDVLAVNARDGQSGTFSRMVINQDVKTTQQLRIEMHGAYTPQELVAQREGLLNRAETMLYIWTQ